MRFAVLHHGRDQLRVGDGERRRPRQLPGSLGAMQNFGGYCGGAKAPMVTGFIVQETGSFVPALLVGAGMCVFAALAFVTIRKPIQPEDLVPNGVRATA